MQYVLVIEVIDGLLDDDSIENVASNVNMIFESVPISSQGRFTARPLSEGIAC